LTVLECGYPNAEYYQPISRAVVAVAAAAVECMVAEAVECV
jgi:hypothetical protein